ncbi:hypothetical protein W822_15350 [Advenella kashmirensis W13003]|uniref:Uncharacterized protein n=1 Tax=Advenella kashmirensis W13003 TaxID=1424334 RepID=V8QST9_9BURK|nr:hypothetical protein W822_15350 [Advenella kashmirensis W13003]
MLKIRALCRQLQQTTPEAKSQTGLNVFAGIKKRLLSADQPIIVIITILISNENF